MMQAFNRLLFSNKKQLPGKIRKDSLKYQLQLSKQPQGSKIIKWLDGTVYIGQCKQQIMQGNGKLIYPNGDYYQGQFKDNNFHGKGIYYNEDEFYDGQWENGLKNGLAKQKNSDKSIYIGKFQKGLKEGIGFFQWPDGSFYQGMFKQDRLEGPGKMAYSDGSQIEGQWKQNKVQGIGKHIDKDGNVYIGNFYHGIKHGQGLLIKNQYKIQGIWKNGNLTGVAFLQKNNGYCVSVQIHNSGLVQLNDQIFQKIRDQEIKNIIS